MTDVVISQGWSTPLSPVKRTPRDPSKRRRPSYPAVVVTEPHHWTGTEIETLRRRLNVSHETLAALLNVNRITVTRWVCGTQPVKNGAHHRTLDLLASHPELFLLWRNQRGVLHRRR